MRQIILAVVKGKIRMARYEYLVKLLVSSVEMYYVTVKSLKVKNYRNAANKGQEIQCYELLSRSVLECNQEGKCPIYSTCMPIISIFSAAHFKCISYSLKI